MLSSEGVEDVYVTDNSVNGDVFLEFVCKCMLPIVMPFDGINPNSVVVMDNASIYHVDEMLELLTGVGVLVKFLPPYSPVVNPIEEFFAEVKHYVQANNQSFGPLMTSTIIVLEAFNSVCKENCQQYNKHSGYTQPKIMFCTLQKIAITCHCN